MRRWRRASVLATAALACAIAPASAVFAVVDAWLWKPLPLPNPDRLLIAFGAERARPNDPSVFPFLRFVDTVRANASTVASAGGAMWASYEVQTAEGQRGMRALQVTPEFIPTLWPGLPAGAPESVYLSAAFARRHGSHPVMLNGKRHAVAAVLPETFAFRMLDMPESVDVYFVAPAGQNPRAPFATVVRVRPGVPLEAARDTLRGLWDTTEKNEWTLLVTPLQHDSTRAIRNTLLTLGAAIAALLLLACTNVASLLVSDGLAREREFSIRVSLGAARRDLIGLLLRETLRMAAVAIPLGIAGANLLIEGFTRYSPLGTLPPRPIELDWRVLTFTTAAGLVTALLAGAVPVWRAAPVMPRRAGLWQPLLLASQIALAGTLLHTTAGLAETLVRLRTGPIGFDPSALYQFRSLASLATLRGIPGVDSVAMSTMPLLSSGPIADVEYAGGNARLSHQYISGDYFQTLHIAFAAGEARDGAVLNALAASNLFGGPEQAIGQRLRVRGESYLVTGVVWNTGSTFYNALAWQHHPTVYLPARGDEKGYFFARAGAGLTRDALSPYATVWEFTPARGAIRDATRQPEFRAAMLSLFGTAALALTALSVFSLTVQTLRRRDREFAIRLALGARGRAVCGLLTREVMGAAAAGLLLGAFLALAAAKPLEALLYGVRAAGALPAGMAACAVLATVAAASLPALFRARRIKPAEVLKHPG